MYFSIIVPIYNVENYINECLESILSQTFTDFELILVDDGSPDSCPQICDEYALKDERISVIHKNNGGLSSARNAGLNIASGEYILFVDSDDVIMTDTLENMKEALRDTPDVLITEYYSSPNCSLDNMPGCLFCTPLSNSKSDVIKFVFFQKKNTWASVQYIINRKLIESKHLRFEEGYYHEDISWTGQLFLQSQTYAFYNRVWYIRRPDRTDSITNVVRPKRTLDTIELVSRQIHSGDYNTLSEDERNTIFNQYVRAVFSSLIYFNRYDRINQIKIEYETKKNIDIFSYALSNKHRVFVALMRLVGLNCSLKLYYLLSKKEENNEV